MHLRFACIALLCLAALPAHAHAAFHLMKIVEVFAGAPASPDAHYVVLQMYSAGQNFVSGHSVIVFDATGAQVGFFTFGGNVPNGANQDRILIATTDAVSFFGVAANLTMTPVIPAAGGKVCFDLIDCVSWGNYVGDPDGSGTPFPELPAARAIARRLDISGSPFALEGTDDTNDSANDFMVTLPAPRNNAGNQGTTPGSTCGNGIIEGLEQCDDNNNDPGDGCAPDCTFESTVDVGPGGVADGGWLRAGPNPFRGDLTVSLSLPNARNAELGIFDLSGRRVRSVFDARLEAGPRQFLWDGRDDEGRAVGPGLYVVRLRSRDLSMSTMVVRLR